MIKKYFKAIIEWIPCEKGGRKKIPPKGTRYCPLIHIYNADKHNEWSIDFICPDFNKTNIITFCFLVNEAPTDLIELNAIYDVCEGTKIVAKILIFEI